MKERWPKFIGSMWVLIFIFVLALMTLVGVGDILSGIMWGIVVASGAVIILMILLLFFY